MSAPVPKGAKMRTFLSTSICVIASLLASPLIATAEQPAKAPDPVEIVAPLPLDVNVTNSTSSSCRSFELVGTTGTAFLGTEGPLNFSRACAEDHPGSRWCTSAEVLGSVSPPGGIRAVAWVRPILVLAAGDSLMDVSGLLAPAPDFTCDSWSSADARGLAVDGNGAFTTHPCSIVRTAVCCAPVE